jgi:hypothetical protein
MGSHLGYRCRALACAALAFSGIAGRADGAVSPCSEVLLVTEQGERDPAGVALAAILGRLIDYYVGEERAFEVTSVRVAELDRRAGATNVVICGVLGNGTDIGRYVGGVLGGEGLARVRSERSAVFKKDDLPGPGQLTVVVAAVSDRDLMSCVKNRGGEIAEILETGCRERLRGYFADRIDQALSRRLHDAYGFSIGVPDSYKVLAEGGDSPGVQLLCEGPARLLGVSWFEWDREPALADSARLFHARAGYVWDAYDEDLMDSTRVSYRESSLGGYRALEMSGYWSSSRSVAGGFYRTFFVYEPREKLLWAVDLLAFAPGMPKHPLLRELHAIAETFRYD